MGTTQELVSYAQRVKFDDLPENVVRQSKRILLDGIGCILGGYVTDRAKIVMEFVDEIGGKPQVTIIGDGQTSCPIAAFANGELIIATNHTVQGPFAHVTHFVIVPCLVMSEYAHAPGKDLIVAIALAHEIGGRVSASMNVHRRVMGDPPRIVDSPWLGYTNTTFGGVVAASRLIGLNEQEAANAFGIAGSSIPVSAKFKWLRTWPPHFIKPSSNWTGWCAQLAVVSALLAKKGYTGDTTILDGEWGFWQMYGSRFFKSEVLTGDLGKVWHLDALKFKYYPGCGLLHTAIDCVIRIIDENEIEPKDIDGILVQGDPDLLAPVRQGHDLKSVGSSGAYPLINDAYQIAVAAYYGKEPGPKWVSPEVMNDSRIDDLMKKVKVEVHPLARELNRDAHDASFFDAIVEVTAKGRTFSTESTGAKGHPDKPMSDEELKTKFRNNASYSSLTKASVEKVIDMCYELEKLDDVTDLFRLLRIHRPR